LPARRNVGVIRKGVGERPWVSVLVVIIQWVMGNVCFYNVVMKFLSDGPLFTPLLFNLLETYVGFISHFIHRSAWCGGITTYKCCV